MVLKIDADHPKGSYIKYAVDMLKADEVIAYPTDTTYGLGCSIFNKKGIKKILDIKKFDERRHLSFICRDFKEAGQYAKITDFSFKIMKKLLPGPYTIILKASPIIPKIMLTKWRTVGIRIPDSEVCSLILSLLEHPLVNTTVRLPGEEIMHEAYEIESALGNRLAVILDGGPLYNEPSTVISLIDDKVEIIRERQGQMEDFLE